MAKDTTIYVCKNCEYKTGKWLGCCPDCKQWNTLEAQQSVKNLGKEYHSNIQLKNLTEVNSISESRIVANIPEWDRVTGGGLVSGAFLMLTGDPGVGKSTLLLQIAKNLSENNKVYYFSSEESLEQVKLRAKRLNCLNDKLLYSDQANLDDIIFICKTTLPQVIILDSIQNCFTQESQAIPGSVNQLRETAFKLMRLAKDYKIAIIATGHITKDGVMAGPKTLEHLVDTVLYFHVEDSWQIRALRAVKNRFGTLNEIGFFNMCSTGLEQVPNINEQLLQDLSNNPGSILISFMEGSRPLLAELQALVLNSKYGVAQRVISGLDSTQIALTAAIIEKYLKINFSAQDIFFKISGGFKIKNNIIDLAIALALLSSYFQKPLPEKTLALGEISLTGNIKPINYINTYAAEAEKFGIKQIIISQNQQIDTKCKVIRVKNIYDLLTFFD